MSLAWTAFLIGLAGSLHCTAMCGPLVLRFAEGKDVLSRLVYNGGRILAYLLIGWIFGMLGQTLKFFVYQQALSIISGVAVLAVLIYPWARKFLPIRSGLSYSLIYSRFVPRLKKYPELLSRTGLGFLNGLLPCGLVYLAASASIYRGSVAYSLLYMLFFGLGTLPVMFGISLVNGFKIFNSAKWKNATLIIVAVFFILRGMALGVPYLSPKVENKTDKVPSCCQHHKR